MELTGRSDMTRFSSIQMTKWNRDTVTVASLVLSLRDWGITDGARVINSSLNTKKTEDKGVHVRS